MLKKIDESIWVNEVPFKLIGIDFGNRMTCIRLSDGSIWIHSPTKFDQSTYQAIKEKGHIKYLIAPSLMHNLFIMDWKEVEPNAQLIAPTKAKNVASDIKLDQTPVGDINQLFAGEISCIPINGIPMVQEHAFIHRASKTLILTDLAFNFKNNISGWSKLFLQLYGAYNKFGPTRTIRALIKDKALFRVSLEEIVKHDFTRIIVAHGDIIETDGKNLFRQAFSRYL